MSRQWPERECETETTNHHPAQHTPSSAAKLNKFLLLIRSTTASLTAQSLSSQCPGPPLAGGQPGLSCQPIGEPDTSQHDFIISH